MTHYRLALLGAAAFGLALASQAGATPDREGPPSAHPCFFVTQWQGWSAPDDHTLLLRVNNRDIYRVELSAGSPMLQAPGVHLVSKVQGSDSICDAIDLQLEVSDGHGFREPLIASSIEKLSPEEAAAVPPKYRP